MSKDIEVFLLEESNFSTQSEMFESVSETLFKKGMVNKNFYNAITKRESMFPTGLKGKKRNIAIPHADPEFVNKSGYIVVKNKTPLKFKNMGNKEEEIEVKLIVFILSSTAEGHMDLLQKTLSLTTIDAIPAGAKLTNFFERSNNE